MHGLRTHSCPALSLAPVWKLCLAAACLHLLAPFGLDAGVSHREIVRVGDAPAGVPSDLAVGTFLETNGTFAVEAVVNSAGWTAFIVPLVPTNGPVVDPVDALFVDKDDGNGPELIGMTGGAISGVAARTFRRLRNLQLGDDGSLLVDDYDANSLQKAVLYRGTNALWSILAEDGQPIAGQPADPLYGAAIYNNISTLYDGRPYQDNGGETQFIFNSAYDSLGGFTLGYWGWNPDVSQVFRFAANSEPAPDLAANELLHILYYGAIAPGMPGKAILEGQYSVQPNLYHAIWFGPLTNLQVVAQTGDAVPSRETYDFYSFGSVGINAAGLGCFVGVWKTNDSLNLYNRGVFLCDQGTNSWLAGAGDPSPGTGGAAGVIAEVAFSAVINAQSQVFFRAAVRRTNNVLIPGELMRWDPDLGLSRLGYPADPQTNLLSELIMDDRYCANSAGDVAVQVIGPGGPGIWATAGDDTPQLIAYSGWNLNPVPDGAVDVAYCKVPYSQYATAAGAGGQDGRTRFYSDNRKLVYAAVLDEPNLPSALYLAALATGAAPSLQYAPTGGGIEFSWSGNYKLQSQTNNLQAGFAGNWVDYPGGTTNPIVVPIGAASGAVFFRLVSQP